MFLACFFFLIPKRQHEAYISWYNVLEMDGVEVLYNAWHSLEWWLVTPGIWNLKRRVPSQNKSWIFTRTTIPFHRTTYSSPSFQGIWDTDIWYKPISPVKIPTNRISFVTSSFSKLGYFGIAWFGTVTPLTTIGLQSSTYIIPNNVRQVVLFSILNVWTVIQLKLLNTCSVLFFMWAIENIIRMKHNFYWFKPLQNETSP